MTSKCTWTPDCAAPTIVKLPIRSAFADVVAAIKHPAIAAP
jgi:hypothetical protein